MEPTPMVSYVKGHQDDTTPYGELDWTSQQNVDAEKLESDFLDQHAVHQVHVPRVQSNKAQLIVQGKPITGHYITEIKCLATFGPLYEYIRVKNKCTQQQIDSINWNAFASALKRIKKKALTVIKLCHGILPTAKQIN
eukprot:5557532-Ditylum_brightwellii.AAC.1